MSGDERTDITRGDVTISFAVRHNVGSVENLNGVIFFRVSITASQTLQVSLIVYGTVNQNQPARRARRSSAKERKLLMEIEALDWPRSFTLTNLLDVVFLDSLRYEQGRVVHV